MKKEYQVIVNMRFELPCRIRAENGQEATDVAHEMLMAMDDYELLDLIGKCQFQYDAYRYTTKRSNEEGKE